MYREATLPTFEIMQVCSRITPMYREATQEKLEKVLVIHRITPMYREATAIKFVCSACEEME